jgi:Dullard-like phosphatase family protein
MLRRTLHSAARRLSTRPAAPYLPPLPQGGGALPRLTLCLDLDECLVHCTSDDKGAPSFQEVQGPEAARTAAAQAERMQRRPPHREPDAIFELPYLEQPVRVHKRPLLDDFLSAACQLCDVVLFTSAAPGYVEQLVPLIEPAGRPFAAVLTRAHCTELDALYVKDLGQLGRPLERAVLLDDNPASFLLQPDNGVPITPWFGAADDRDLGAILPLLRHLSSDDDVRPRLRERFKLQELLLKGMRESRTAVEKHGARVRERRTGPSQAGGRAASVGPAEKQVMEELGLGTLPDDEKW